MATTRTITFNFENDDFYSEIDFGTYALMLFYAKQLKSDKAKLLFDSTMSEYRYRIVYNLPLDTLTYDDYEAHFNVTEIQDIISFIDNDLSAALNNETQDLIDKYGGVAGFISLFATEPGFLGSIKIYDDEFYLSDPSDIAAVLDAHKTLLSHAISINQIYTVNII